MSNEQDFSGLIQALASENKRFEAAEKLIDAGSSAVEPLVSALKFDNWRVRGNAAWTLGEIGDARAVNGLVEALDDSVPEVRATAGRALVNIGRPSIGPLLKLIEKRDCRAKGLVSCILSCLGVDEAQRSIPKPA
ncbi:MAG TPA: HEAT repeat domain-containing protein [Methanocella sp.]|uniref:HEAT repeat domain-containing protein n=1 Tax=Methanocella sp. TaxID=2052833 RepID=UPI002C231EC3|nr:HEAT repeat domain-containing protein [Methanocella sp.]HTY90739.1 HEAT repeat domain-containing protein [Methanocella sp.]